MFWYKQDDLRAGRRTRRDRRVKLRRITQGRIRDDPAAGVTCWTQYWTCGRTPHRMIKIVAWWLVWSIHHRRCYGSQRACRRMYQIMDNVCSLRCQIQVYVATRQCQ